MKGDFTRGTKPDRKRGKRYRRVLVQQSRVLLDSDAAALVDSFDSELRQITAELGCHRGSPDYGFLVTPGRLLALFEHVDRVVATAPATAVRDYSRKYPEEPNGRYPSLRITGAGAVTIPLVEPVASDPAITTLALWYRADSAVTISVTAGTANTSLSLAAATTWTRVTAAIAIPASTAISSITITGAASPVWIALCELDEQRQHAKQQFWAAAGRFHAEGWTPALSTATGYPELSYSETVGFPNVDPDLASATPPSSIVAYLETWERDITAAEDPGIREVALGRIDTTVRTEVIGQVKWANAGTLTAAALHRAFDAVAAPASTLTVNVTASSASSDPCALPITGGYTGADHRLYRFEVHEAGTPSSAKLKWSRDNASAVFVVRDLSGAVVTLDRESGLSGGDIVEVLSEVVDLGDADRAAVTAGGVTLARRRVGMLARVAALEADSQGRDRFELHDLTTPTTLFVPASDPVRYPATEPLRLRRWDGVAVAGAGNIARIEDGIEITLGGQFQPGEYWQYEARRGAQNENGTWRASPHGPERVLAPLALLDLSGAPSAPMFLRAWLDDRFSSLCELDADDIEFDGDRIGSDADTVQEAIEELYERDLGNCCDATLGPNGPTGDDALRIMAAITATTFPDGGHLCLEPGVYHVATPIKIDRDIVIRGCPEAVIYGTSQEPLFAIGARGRLRIEQLILSAQDGPSELVLVDGGGRLAAREVGFLNGSLAAIRQVGATSINADNAPDNDPVIDPDNLPPREDLGVQLDLRDCVLLAKRGIDITYGTFVSVARTAFVLREAGIAAQQIDQLHAADCSFRDGPAPLWTPVPPELLRARTDDILDAAASLAPGNGYGIIVEYLLGGVLERNRARTLRYLWSRVARDLCSRDEDYERGSNDGAIGFRIHHARRFDIDAARLTGERGVDVALSARHVRVRSCELDTHTFGVVVASENTDLVNAGTIVGVHIVGNHIAAGANGVSIAPKGTKAGIVDDVRIADNVIRISSKLATACAIRAASDASLLDTVIIDGNDITTEQLGIDVVGVGLVIRGNQLRLATLGPAISAVGTEAIGLVSVVDNVITGTSNGFTAIRMSKVPDARVTGNQVRTTAADQFWSAPTALELVGASLSKRHYVANNDFAIGTVNIKNANELGLFGNSIRMLLVDSGQSGNHGIVHGNRFGGIFLASAMITARGMWKVSDNIAPVAISITGATHQEGLVWVGPLLTAGNYTRFRDVLEHIPAATAAATAGPAMRELMVRRDENTYSSPANPPMYATEWGEPSRVPPNASTASAPAIVDDIRDLAIRDTYGPIRDFIIANDVLLAARTVPDPLDAHVSGNRAGLLIVSTAGTTPPEGSSIHVVDNKVTLVINLNPFTTKQHACVVALNSAPNFDPSGYTTTTPIAAPNLEY